MTTRQTFAEYARNALSHRPRVPWYRLSVPGWSPVRRIVGLFAITWVPMFVFALVQGVAIAPTPRGSFLLDFATYARFFIGIPSLIVAETIIDPRLQGAMRRFVDDKFVRDEDLHVFERAKARLARRRSSVVVTILIAALAAFGAWRLTVEAERGFAPDSWQSIHLGSGHLLRYSLAALWNHMVAVPVVLFLGYRWIWRIIIWAVFLMDVARLDLELVPTHSDRMGGLGFLEEAHRSYAALALAVSSVVSADAAFRIVFERANLDVFEQPGIVLLVIMQTLFLGPLLVFCPVLARGRRIGVMLYGALAVHYNRDFHEKWVKGSFPGDAALLGAADIQSLADMGNSYRYVNDMRAMPFGRRAILTIAVATVLPGLPLLLLVVPLREVIRAMAKAVL